MTQTLAYMIRRLSAPSFIQSCVSIFIAVSLWDAPQCLLSPDSLGPKAECELITTAKVIYVKP